MTVCGAVDQQAVGGRPDHHGKVTLSVGTITGLGTDLLVPVEVRGHDGEKKDKYVGYRRPDERKVR